MTLEIFCQLSLKFSAFHIFKFKVQLKFDKKDSHWNFRKSHYRMDCRHCRARNCYKMSSCNYSCEVSKPLETICCRQNPVFMSPYASAPFPCSPCPVEISSCFPSNCNESTICAIKSCCPPKCCKRC